MPNFIFVGKSKELNNANKNDDDVYETIDLSDSSHHIYSEPFKTESNYGALRKVTVKTNNSKQTTLSTSYNKKSVNSASSSKKGIKKSTRVRNLQKYPALQDVSKAPSFENDSEKDEVDGTKVQLRVKSTSPSNMSSNSRQIASKQINALVSVGLTELINLIINCSNLHLISLHFFRTSKWDLFEATEKIWRVLSHNEMLQVF